MKQKYGKKGCRGRVFVYYQNLGNSEILHHFIHIA